ncbi:MAG TPA: adenosine deaminase [Candidatus Polarisedimenticolia bacterium]|nr:adenosine deaminase [Candidatus Polarisedimenticolia bacterium]
MAAPPPSFGAIPKAEIHLHLEGSIDLETLVAIRGRRRQMTSDGERRRLAALYRHNGFIDFLVHFAALCEELGDPEDFALAATRLAERLGDQHVIYAEVMCSPGIFVRRGIPPQEILDAVTAAGAAAAKKGGPRLQWILDSVRQWGPAAFEPLVEHAAAFLSRGVVGVGIGGDESAWKAKDFAMAYREARRLGLRTTAHAGEFSGPGSVWEAIETLQVDRIGHGVRAVEDEKLVHLLAERRVPLECCPTSNIATGIVPDWDAHPIPALVRAGVFVTVGSDDPAMFGTTLLNEWNVLHQRLGLTSEEVLRVGRNTLEAAFLKHEEKKALLSEFDRSAERHGL